MIRPSCLMLAGAGLLSASAVPATAATPAARFHPPRLLTGPSAAPASAAASARPLAHSKTASWRRRQHEAAGAPLSRVAAANRSAVREPSADDYLGAAQVYPWTEGALYRLYAAPGREQGSCSGLSTMRVRTAPLAQRWTRSAFRPGDSMNALVTRSSARSKAIRRDAPNIFCARRSASASLLPAPVAREDPLQSRDLRPIIDHDVGIVRVARHEALMVLLGREKTL